MFLQLIPHLLNITGVNNWSKDCAMSTIADTTSKITNTKLYVPIVTLSSKDNSKLVKLLEE